MSPFGVFHLYDTAQYEDLIVFYKSLVQRVHHILYLWCLTSSFYNFHIRGEEYVMHEARRDWLAYTYHGCFDCRMTVV